MRTQTGCRVDGHVRTEQNLLTFPAISIEGCFCLIFRFLENGMCVSLRIIEVPVMTNRELYRVRDVTSSRS
jgi:hypothetical protein